MNSFLPQDLIRKKRDGHRLDQDEIEGFIHAVANETIADYQVTAMLMAIFFRGLDDEELAVWTRAMLHSGDILDLSAIATPKVDKHSTGGIGDKISLPLAPVVAACGVAVPMIAGRGLGHTGGTLDKLESIPGFRIELGPEDFVKQLRDLGACICGQSERLAPADKRLYALRDVTATVESIPLIASSIMSKKLAEGIDGLVLDCKVGLGAFMTQRDRALELARAIAAIGAAAGVAVTTLITDMNAPIGRFVGNALEIRESIDVMRGGGPRDTRELTVRLGAEMLGLAQDRPEPQRIADIETALDQGSALAKFAEIVAAQGGDPRVVEAPEDVLPRARYRDDVVAGAAGFVQEINSRAIGIAALHLGAGRRRHEDKIDPGVGLEMLKEPGDSVQRGEPVVVLHHNDRGVDSARKAVLEAFSIAPERREKLGTRVIEVLR